MRIYEMHKKTLHAKTATIGPFFLRWLRSRCLRGLLALCVVIVPSSSRWLFACCSSLTAELCGVVASALRRRRVFVDRLVQPRLVSPLSLCLLLSSCCLRTSVNAFPSKMSARILPLLIFWALGSVH